MEAEGARGAAQPANERRGEKVDVIDEALARVSERLDAVRDAGVACSTDLSVRRPSIRAMKLGRLDQRLPRHAWWSLIGGVLLLLAAIGAGRAGWPLPPSPR